TIGVQGFGRSDDRLAARTLKTQISDHPPPCASGLDETAHATPGDSSNGSPRSQFCPVLHQQIGDQALLHADATVGVAWRGVEASDAGGGSEPLAGIPVPGQRESVNS